MIIVWGSRLYGKTDEVDGHFCVATRFGHLWFVPLIPLGSYLIFNHAGNEPRGVQIPLSHKSLLLGWFRAACVIAAIIAAVCYLDQSAESGAWSIALLSVVALAVFFATKLLQPFRFASYERAKKLATLAGYNAKGMALLDIQFGAVHESKAREILANAEARDLAELEQALQERKSALQGVA